MSTKAELLSAVEAISKAVATAAKVATELQEEVILPPPVQAADIAFIKLADGSLVVTGGPGIVDIKWVAIHNSPPDYPWYGQMQNAILPCVLHPTLARPTDFVKVFYGSNFSKSIDSPKADTVPAIPINDGPRTFVKNMTVNVNIERLRPTYMKYQGSSLTTQPYYSYLASKGISGVRLFIPYRADLDMGIGTGVPTVDAWDAILDAAQAANMAGLSVMCGCTDVVGEGVIKFDDWNQHADNVAKRVAERGFDPKLFALEVANELAGNDNAFWNKMRTDVHATIRKRLPMHTIVHGCAGWNGISQWNTSWTPPADKNIILQFHDYGFHTAEDWSQIEVFLTDFARIHDVPIINGEQGIDVGRGGFENQQEWMNNLWNMSKGAGILRPCPWTVTDGNGFRLNRSSADPTLTTLVEQSIPYFVNFVKATPGWGV
jgi:hypothetical protein